LNKSKSSFENVIAGLFDKIFQSQGLSNNSFSKISFSIFKLSLLDSAFQSQFLSLNLFSISKSSKTSLRWEMTSKLINLSNFWNNRSLNTTPSLFLVVRSLDFSVDRISQSHFCLK